MNNKISFIIPSYNCEKYIEKCIASIMRIKSVSIEIIIINDGSNDSTIEIVEGLKRSDNRIKLINQENLGVSAARNTGIRIASGDYLVFVDSDDEIDPSNFEKMLLNNRSYDFDVLCYGYTKVFNDKKMVKIFECNEEYVLDDITIYEDFIKNIYLNDNYTTAVWNKIYRKNFILENNIFFTDYKVVNSEDQLFNFACISFAKKIIINCVPIYNYYIREGTLSHSKRYDGALLKNYNSYKKICSIANKKMNAVNEKLVHLFYLQSIVNYSVLEKGKNNCSFCHLIKGVKTLIKKMEKIQVNYSLNFGNILIDKRKRTKYVFINHLVKRKLFFLCSVLLTFYSIRNKNQ